MATTRRSKRVLCPMYIGDGPIEICCEGPFDLCPRVTLSFRNRNACEQHMALFCDKDYCCCEVYRMVMAAKYDDAAPPLDGSRTGFNLPRGHLPRSHERNGRLGHKKKIFDRYNYSYYNNKHKGGDGMEKANRDLRLYAIEANVFLWQIAEAYEVSYVTLNNWLRKEMDEQDKTEFKCIVDKIAGEK